MNLRYCSELQEALQAGVEYLIDCQENASLSQNHCSLEYTWQDLTLIFDELGFRPRASPPIRVCGGAVKVRIRLLMGLGFHGLRLPMRKLPLRCALSPFIFRNSISVLFTPRQTWGSSAVA